MLWAKVLSQSPSQRGIDGPLAVQFFQLSGLSIDILREIWNLASVYK
jgi:hypothetical protein